MVLPPAVEVIQATLAPAFMISGTSVFLNFAQNRLFRVTDRIRGRDVAHDGPAGLERLVQRAHLLRNGIALGVLTVGLTVASAILVMASELFGAARLANAAPYAFALALLAFFAALLLVFSDTVVSVSNVERRH